MRTDLRNIRALHRYDKAVPLSVSSKEFNENVQLWSRMDVFLENGDRASRVSG